MTYFTKIFSMVAELKQSLLFTLQYTADQGLREGVQGVHRTRARA